MFQQRRFGFDWTEFLTGIAFLVAAVVMLRNPGATLVTLTFIFAVVAIVRGVTTLAAYSKLRDVIGGRAGITLVSGVLDIILGILFLFNIPAGALTITYLFAFWFIMDSVVGIVSASHLRAAGTGWFIFDLIFQILGLIVGILLLMNPVVSAVGLVTLLAMAFIVFGITALVVAFGRRGA